MDKEDRIQIELGNIIPTEDDEYVKDTETLEEDTDDKKFEYVPVSVDDDGLFDDEYTIEVIPIDNDELEEDTSEREQDEFLDEDVDSSYEEKGYDNRADYLRGLASIYGIDEDVVFNLADSLGKDEDFDALVSTLEEFSETQDFELLGDEPEMDQKFRAVSYKTKGVMPCDFYDEVDEMTSSSKVEIDAWILHQAYLGRYITLFDETGERDPICYSCEYYQGPDTEASDLIVF